MNGSADASYKFGAGRYLQSQGLLEQAGEEIARYGRRPFVIGGPTALSVAWPRLERGLKAAGLEATLAVYPGQVCHGAAREQADAAQAAGCDAVVGVGGGRMMDFAKLCAYYLGTRVVNIPTVLSTCAAYTPFSLIYTPEGQTIPGNFCYDQEVASVLVDMDVMAGQPRRYIVSGMLDAMGKYLEIMNGRTDMDPDSPLSLYAGALLTRLTFEKLTALADPVCRDIADRRVTRALEEVVFLNLPLTGIISALSRGVGQSAIAHELYYQARLRFTAQALGSLHGEIVGVGILMQLHYNGMEDKIPDFLRMLTRLGAPTCLSEIGITPTPENCRVLRDAIAQTAFVGDDPASREKFCTAFERIAH